MLWFRDRPEYPDRALLVGDPRSLRNSDLEDILEWLIDSEARDDGRDPKIVLFSFSNGFTRFAPSFYSV